MANSTVARCSPRAKGIECKPTPGACPDCGALECLCRPRFFAGQLLTEQDLNLLDQYIKKKHRLENRNLHGWGVANGLFVVCDPCGDVKVTPGYALSPCGDDIVVCEETAVGLCELVRACRRVDPRPCRPNTRPPSTDCAELEEDWVLAIRYREWSTRGVTPLRVASCERPCGCNGDEVSAPRGAPTQCEPTVVCEGFAFDVYRAPEPVPASDDERESLLDAESPLWQQFLCCAQPLLDAIPLLPDLSNPNNVDQNRAALASWCCRFRAALLDLFGVDRNVRCELIEYLQAIVCPSANQDSFEQDWLQAFLSLVTAWFEGLKNCLCLALLPQAPVATDDDRVPLASIRLRARDCKVLSICNWTTERRILVTWPAVRYWTGVLRIGHDIRQLIERICCNSLLGIFDDVIGDNVDQPNLGQPLPPGGDFAGASFVASSNQPGASQPATERARVSLAEGLSRASGVFAGGVDTLRQAETVAALYQRISARGDTTLQLGAVLNAVSSRFRLPTGGAPLSSVERNNLPLLLAAELIGKPALRDLGGALAVVGGLGPSLGVLPRTITTTPAAVATDDRVAAMSTTIEQLRTRLDAQDAQLSALRQRIDGNG